MANFYARLSHNVLFDFGQLEQKLNTKMVLKTQHNQHESGELFEQFYAL